MLVKLITQLDSLEDVHDETFYPSVGHVFEFIEEDKDFSSLCTVRDPETDRTFLGCDPHWFTEITALDMMKRIKYGNV